MTTTDRTQLLRILGELDRFLVGVLDPILAEIGIGREHWQVLRLLDEGQARPMGDIARELGLTGATATRVIDLLATNMFVYRRSDPLDRRRVLIHISDLGHESLHRAMETLDAHAGTSLGSLDPAEREQLGDLLTRFAQPIGEQAG